MSSSKPHWVNLEEEIKTIIGFNAKRTKGSGNKKGDLDVKCTYQGTPILFEAKSEEIPNGNVIVKHTEFTKMLEQAAVFFGIGIYVRKDKNGIPIACMQLTDLKRLMDLGT